MQDNIQEIPPTFSSDLIQLNELSDHGFTSWLIEPGMGFNDRRKWWGNRGMRPTAHEGVDISLFYDLNGQIQTLSAGIIVPVILPGRIIKVMEDFIAKTVIVSHEHTDSSRRLLHTFYAHVDPDDSISTGSNLSSGAIVGRLAFPKDALKCPAHLHLSAAWIDKGTSAATFAWDEFSTEKNIISFDPIAIISP